MQGCEMGEVVYIALGSNLGDRAAYLAGARGAVGKLPRTRVLAESPEEETAPFGPPGQDPYLNQMIAIDPDLPPHELLDALQAIEQAAGRTRDVRWGARTLDLDIVRHGTRTIHDARLEVPHPGLKDRDFWRREMAWLDEALRG
jgi:2-amino-4-hydroxy-6-hydroxymethyldihydropteridine diphosphokinase